MIKNSQRQKAKRAEAKWLLSLIGEDWGIRVLPSGADKPRPVHANRNQPFEAVISKGAWKKTAVPVAGIETMLDDEPERRPSAGIWLDRLSQKLIIRHFDGVPREFRIKGEVVAKPETVYFTGRRYRKGETCLTILMIDIDAHKVGDLKGAMRFAGHLRDNFLPDCYVEVSTNGNGGHVFLIVDKTDWEDVQYNAVLREFDHWLKGVLAETGIVLDGVEVKGTCALVTWKDGMPEHTAGLLAKLPREWERFGELRASPTYTAHQLLAMPKAHPVEVTKKTVARVQRMRREASVPARGVDPDRLERWIEVGRRLLPSGVHVGRSADNRLVVTGEDVGIVCAMLEFVGKHMNGDGTLPWARTKGLWDCLHERGVVRRAFNAKRFAWIRRFLSGAGLVEMQDPTYVVGVRAAKWSPSERFWKIASSLDHKEGEEEQDLAETRFVTDPEECWQRGIPLVMAGIGTTDQAERRRRDELVEAIVCQKWWDMAA